MTSIFPSFFTIQRHGGCFRPYGADCTAIGSCLHLIRRNELFRTLTFYFCQRSVGWLAECILLFTGSKKSFLESGTRKKKKKKTETNKTERRSYPSLSSRVTLRRFCHSRPVTLNRAKQLVTHFHPHGTNTLRFITNDKHTTNTQIDCK